MPAPKRANNTKATEAAQRAARRRRLSALADELRAAGYTVTPPVDDTAPTPEQLRTQKIARVLLSSMADAICADVDPAAEDADDRLALADVLRAAVPYVSDPNARDLVLPIAKLAQRMYRGALADADFEDGG